MSLTFLSLASLLCIFSAVSPPPGEGNLTGNGNVTTDAYGQNWTSTMQTLQGEKHENLVADFLYVNAR